MNTTNYYAWTPEHLEHLSVGAVIQNEAGNILVHKLARIGGKYFLPKKTHTPNATLEQTFAEVEKETGWKSEIVNYIGSIQSTFGDSTNQIDKTTLYFLCKPVLESARDQEDRDADSELVWMDKQELIDIFKQQGQTENDLDQSSILAKLS